MNTKQKLTASRESLYCFTATIKKKNNHSNIKSSAAPSSMLQRRDCMHGIYKLRDGDSFSIREVVRKTENIDVKLWIGIDTQGMEKRYYARINVQDVSMLNDTTHTYKSPTDSQQL
jgi:hypothetical protein